MTQRQADAHGGVPRLGNYSVTGHQIFQNDSANPCPKQGTPRPESVRIAVDPGDPALTVHQEGREGPIWWFACEVRLAILMLEAAMFSAPTGSPGIVNRIGCR